jgi:hypothetical protein
MYQLTIPQLLIGALVFIFCIVAGVRAALEYRRENVAAFWNYFGPEYERDILQHSALSETEDWLADLPSRFAPFYLHDSEPNEQGTRVNGATRRHCESTGLRHGESAWEMDRERQSGYRQAEFRQGD